MEYRRRKDIFERNDDIIENIIETEELINNVCEENECLNEENETLTRENEFISEHNATLKNGINDLYRSTKRVRGARRYATKEYYNEGINMRKVDCPFAEQEDEKINKVSVGFHIGEQGKINLSFFVIVFSLILLGLGITPGVDITNFEVMTEMWVGFVMNFYNIIILTISALSIRKLWKVIKKR